MMHERWRRRAITAASLIAGAALWEIGGRRAGDAFMAPLSETVIRLSELAQTGELLRQTVSSLGLFLAGFALAVLFGIPLGLLLARLRLLRVAFESYITMLYATPMVALIPFIL